MGYRYGDVVWTDLDSRNAIKVGAIDEGIIVAAGRGRVRQRAGRLDRATDPNPHHFAPGGKQRAG